MSCYKGRFKLELEEMSIPNKVHNNVVRFKFSVSFNGLKLFLGKAMLDQLLNNSEAIKNYIMSSSLKEINSNKEKIEKRIQNIYTSENEVSANVSIRGMYFFIDLYCGRNHTIDDIHEAVGRILSRRKTQLEILRG